MPFDDDGGVGITGGLEVDLLLPEEYPLFEPEELGALDEGLLLVDGLGVVLLLVDGLGAVLLPDE